jgi:signal peptide peptidase SppA
MTKKLTGNVIDVDQMVSAKLGDVALISQKGLAAVNTSTMERTQADESFISSLALQAANEGEGYEYMSQVVGNVAVINIQGVLVNNADPYNRYFGEVGYPEIKGAILDSVSDSNVDTILLLINSPGGSAAGITEVSELLEALSAQYKVHTHIEGMGCSGGYWLSCAAGSTITASTMAEVGSIGVISVLRSVYQMYKDSGIDMKVLRQGKYKALGNPYEPISQEAEDDALSKMKVIYDIFLDVVAKARNISIPTLVDTAAEGRVFIGKDALRVGLIDSIASTEQVLYGLLSPTLVAKPANSGDDMTKGNKKFKVLTPAAQAAIAAGISEAQVMASLSVEEAAPAEETPPTDGAAPAEETPPTDGAAPAEETPPTDGAAPAEETPPTDGAGVLALSREVAAMAVRAAQFESNLAVAQAKVESLESDLLALRPIAIQACHNMQIALGGSAVPMDSATPEAIAAQYVNLKAAVETRFPVGGLAEVGAGENQSGNTSAGNVTAFDHAARRHTTFGRK